MTSVNSVTPISQVRRIGELRQLLGYGENTPQHNFFKERFDTFRRGYQTPGGKPGTSLYKWQAHQSELTEMAEAFLLNEGQLFFRDQPGPGGNLGDVILAYSNKEIIKNHLKQLIYRLNEAQLSNFRSNKIRQDPDELPSRQGYGGITVSTEPDRTSPNGSSYHPSQASDEGSGESDLLPRPLNPTWGSTRGDKRKRAADDDIQQDQSTKKTQPNTSQDSTISTNPDQLLNVSTKSLVQRPTPSQIDTTFIVLRDGSYEEWHPQGGVFMEKSLAQVILEVSDLYAKKDLSRLTFRLWPDDENNSSPMKWAMSRDNELIFKLMKKAMRKHISAWLEEKKSKPLVLVMEIELIPDKKDEAEDQSTENVSI